MANDNQHVMSSIGLEPVSEASPCGENIRYESVFEELEAELAKQESLNSDTVDWNRVSTVSAGILKDSSKDLLVASYLCQSLLINEGYTGLAVGLKILSDMTETHWDCLFPPAKRMRARATSLVWLAEKAGAYAAEHIPSKDESQAVLDAYACLRALDGELVEKMGDQAPMLTDLSRPLKNYKQSADAELASSVAAAEPVEAAASAADAAPSETPQAAPAATPPPVAKAPEAKAPEVKGRPAATAQAVGSVESDNEAKKALRQIQDSGRKVSTFWQVKKASDAKAFRLARLLGWLMIEVAPPATEGVTQVSPVAADRLKYFDVQIEKAEFATLLPELEQTLSRSPFWLDGQFKVITVLRALGAEYDAAAKTVIAETRCFLERLPGLIDLSFSDATPFASDQTKMWLSSEVLLAGGGAGSSEASTAGSATANAWDTALAEARKKAAGGDSEAAMAIFQQGISGASQTRDKFYWRCAMADLMLQTGKVAAASGLLETMALKANEYKLAEWEPDLMAKIYQLLFQSYKKQQSKKKEDPAIKQLIEKAYEQLCWFDPVTATTMKEG